MCKYPEAFRCIYIYTYIHTYIITYIHTSMYIGMCVVLIFWYTDEHVDIAFWVMMVAFEKNMSLMFSLSIGAH